MNVSFDHYFTTYPTTQPGAGSLGNMLDFHREGGGQRLFLDPATGQPTSRSPIESRVRAQRRGHRVAAHRG